MRIGWNLLFLLPGVGGTETYATSLLDALLDTAGPDEDYVLFLNRESADHPLAARGDVEVVVCDVGATSRPARYRFEQSRLPSLARRAGLDVLHSLGYVGPVWPRLPHVVTVHDLIYVGFAEHMAWRRRLALRVVVRAVARRADVVTTVSETSRLALLDDIGLDPLDVVVASPAARPDLHRPTDDAIAEVRDRLGLPAHYLIGFSSRIGSKNIPALVEAHARSRSAEEHGLVIVGHVPDDGTVEAAIDASPRREHIVRTGFVDDDDVAPLIAGADLYAFPSLYEGFGMPALDAQVLGTPLACSRVASLPEVAGDGAEYFDPTDVADIAAAIDRVLGDPARSRDLIARGAANASRFRWSDAAAATRAVYRRACGASETA